MPMINEQFGELLEPGLRNIFMEEYAIGLAQAKHAALFNIQTSQKAQEHDLDIVGFGQWQAYDGRIDYDDAEQGYKTTFTHEEFTRGFGVKRKLVDDDQYNVINRLPRMLAYRAMQKREIDAASVFNNAFSASYTGGDAVAMCASHPYSPSNASTQSNAGSSAISYAAIVATREAGMALKDHRGELTPVMYDTLVVPPTLEEEAWQIYNAVGKPGTADNDGNFGRRVLIKEPVVWPYLTDANNWFMLDSRLASFSLNWFDRVPVEFAYDPASSYNLEARYRGYMRYSYGWSDWRFVYGHNVT